MEDVAFEINAAATKTERKKLCVSQTLWSDVNFLLRMKLGPTIDMSYKLMHEIKKKEKYGPV